MQVSSLLHSSQSPALDPKRHSALIHPHQYTVCASIHSMCTNTQYVHQYTVCAPIDKYMYMTVSTSIHTHKYCPKPVFIMEEDWRQNCYCTACTQSLITRYKSTFTCCLQL
eukprot:scpid85114/ scgid22292/ 